MAPTTVDEPVEIDIPALPAQHDQFVQYVAAHPDTPMIDLLEPYKQYDTELRKVFAQQPDHPAADQPNVVPVFAGQEQQVKIRARDPKSEPEDVRENYIMPLRPAERKAQGIPAIVQSLQEFRTNFAIFSESSLADMDWSNVVVAGSAVVTSMLSVPKEHAGSKRALRNYYHETLAPASDVDLFLYGLTEDQAIEKIKQIEQKVRDALLVETTTIRTKHAITIASQYPTRHVQIVLRIYKSISEILTGFDVDCSCAAYDGKQVWASPRALAAYMTQMNTIDLTRRSPSYENRLSKYRNRGFEIYWPHLDRSRIDPTIFERSFARTEGLARLLILEKLPKNEDREAYIDKRRAERGRPMANRSRMRQMKMWGNIKDKFEDEVAEWVDEEETSNYHTFTVPYGPKFHAKKIEKLLFTKDLLLNSEWNKPKDREVNLHRHPAFFGTAEDVMGDCCGYCPEPSTVEEEEVAEQESKIYVHGGIEFIKDDAGRQTIGSFHPLSADDYTEMAYVGDTQLLCQAIVDKDVEYVRQWLAQEGNDPNTRDYTGRAPLHLAVSQSSLEVVQCLIDNGARLVARLVDGKTALHLAAIRGDVEIVSALLRKSEANEEEEEAKVDARRKARKAAKEGDVQMQDAANQSKAATESASEDESDVDMMDDAKESEKLDATTEGSLIDVKKLSLDDSKKSLEDEDEDEPDVYDVNVLGWDIAASPLHFAVVKGHTDVVKCLVQEFGADVLLPIKLFDDYDRSAAGAILTLVLALQLSLDQAKEMTKTLFALGASSAQADVDSVTAFQYSVGAKPDMLDTYFEHDSTGVGRAMKHVTVSGYQYGPDVSGPLTLAIQNRDSLTALRLLTAGIKPEITFEAYMRAYMLKWESRSDSEENKRSYDNAVEQPVLLAVECELPLLAAQLVADHGVDPNTITKQSRRIVRDRRPHFTDRGGGESLLDRVRGHIQKLRDWKPRDPEDQKTPAPTPLEEDSVYLSPYEEDSYARWAASKQLDGAKNTYEWAWKDHVERIKAAQEKKGWEEKQAAVLDLLDQYRKLETLLLEKSAKTFKELYPNIEEPKERPSYNYGYNLHSYKQEPFQVSFVFSLPDVSDEAHARYLKLYEAAWQGDLKTVKELTLLTWQNSEGESRPPLHMAVQQRENGLSPFAVAVARGHLELAKAMMEIAKAQYAPPDAPKQHRYRIANDEDEADEYEEDDGSGADIALAADVVDDQFTLENIGEIDVQVKSNVRPLSMLQWMSNYMWLQDLGYGAGATQASSPRARSNKRTNTGSLKALKSMAEPDIDIDRQNALRKPNFLVEYAIYNNDTSLLTWIVDLGEEYLSTGEPSDSQSANESRIFPLENHFDYAIQSGHCQILAEMMRRTGAGIPIDHFVQKSGIEITERPKYYQGLSVHGQKRKDWADAGREGSGYEEIVHKVQPPLLKAAHEGSLEVVEWFLSDAPLRCYKQFAETHASDKRLQQLSQVKGGFPAFVKKFLSTRAKLALHCVLMGEETPESLELLKYLTEAMPETLEAKNKEGLTPLHIAFNLWRLDSAKILIDAGADQTARDKDGRNLLHHIVSNLSIRTKPEFVDRMQKMIELIDQRVAPSMFLERCSLNPGSLTPLALWVQSDSSNWEIKPRILHVLLVHSRGVEVDLVNGEGNTPIHVIVKDWNVDLALILLAHRPQLVNRENAVGRTPFEMAEDRELASMCKSTPSLQRERRHGRNSILDKPPEEFTEEWQKDDNESRPTVWQLVHSVKQQLDGEGRGQRKLVTLNEANEVARRLAASRNSRAEQSVSGGSVKSEDDEEEEAIDEVQMWLGRAARRYSP